MRPFLTACIAIACMLGTACHAQVRAKCLGSGASKDVEAAAIRIVGALVKQDFETLAAMAAISRSALASGGQRGHGAPVERTTSSAQGIWISADPYWSGIHDSRPLALHRPSEIRNCPSTRKPYFIHHEGRGETEAVSCPRFFQRYFGNPAYLKARPVVNPGVRKGTDEQVLDIGNPLGMAVDLRKTWACAAVVSFPVAEGFGRSGTWHPWEKLHVVFNAREGSPLALVALIHDEQGI